MVLAPWSTRALAEPASAIMLTELNVPDPELRGGADGGADAVYATVVPLTVAVNQVRSSVRLLVAWAPTSVDWS